MFALADRLGKTLGEIGAMPVDEFNGWLAYFALKTKGHIK